MIDGSLRLVRHVWALLVPAFIVSTIVVVAEFSPASFQQTVTTMLIDLILVVGLYVFSGNSGVLSFGHTSFMAIGAYVTAFLTIAPVQKRFLLPGLPEFLLSSKLPAIPAALLAGLAAAAFALLLAIPLMRITGIAASLGMFAVLLIVYVVVGNWNSVTGGQGGILGVPTNTTMLSALIWAVITLSAAFIFQKSTLGLRLRASREDEIAARASGVGVFYERTVAFVLSAFIVGIGGSLFAQSQGAFSPLAFYLDITVITVAMLVIGGLTSLAGAVSGTIVASAFLEAMNQLEIGLNIDGWHVQIPGGLREVGFGVLLLLILIVRPKGLTNGEEIRWPFGRGRDRVHMPHTASDER